MIRVFREGNGSYWLELHQYEDETHYDTGEAYIKENHDTLDTMPEKIADKLAMLLHADIGKEMVDIGRRISADTYWVYADIP